jgi:hypothetical protein|nr:hypothetical protein [Kofleriaceae bacterium]
MKTVFNSLAVAAAVAACSSTAPTGTGDSGNGSAFIAFASTFQGFRTWTMFHDDGPADDGTYPPDVLGPRSQYINTLPPHGSTEFPVGTVIVEARESGTMKIFSGVKRGGGFNEAGARNWEWFELQEGSGGSAMPQDPGAPVTITWRGNAPPPGDTYGADGSAGCNACHARCGGTNDYVCSPEMQLSTF